MAERADDQMRGELIGTASNFREVLARLPILARAEGPVLITGETGTGKELAARAIHALSPRAAQPFVAVNCGALVDTLLESELFGHERGAFTDAHARHPGLIAQAVRGTLFLDELGTLSARAQAALLRFLQDGSFRALGSTVEQRADVRFVAATNAPLANLVRAGSFRADFYYRVSVFSVSLPPLRERAGGHPAPRRALPGQARAERRGGAGGSCRERSRRYWPPNGRATCGSSRARSGGRSPRRGAGSSRPRI